MSHQSGVLTALSQRFKKLNVAEVRTVQSSTTLCARCVGAVQSPATLCARCVGAVQSPRTHAQNKRRGLAFAQRVRQRDV